MKIEAHSVWSYIRESIPEEVQWVDETLSVPDTRIRAHYYGDDTRRRFLHVLSHQFPTGLLSQLLQAHQEANAPFALMVEDKRPPAPCGPDPSADLGWLRPYQREAVDAFVRHGRGLIKAPTGAGKTEVLIGITRALPCVWGMAVHRTSLVEQAQKRYQRRTGLRAGSFTGGTWDPGEGNFTAFTFQALQKAMKDKHLKAHAKAFLRGLQGLLIDECHAQSAKSWYTLTMGCEAYFRGGVSGTPLDKGEFENLRIQGALGPVIHEIPTGVLVDGGVLAKPVIVMVPCVQLAPPGMHEEWGQVYRALVEESIPRNRLLGEMALRAMKPCLLFVEHVEHGHRMLKVLHALGLKAGLVHGTHGVDARKRAVKHLLQGHEDVLVCSGIFQEGIDIPELASVVVGTGKASIVGTLQRIGRGMRVSSGKTTFEVFDVLDVGQQWLQRHAEERRNTYLREGHNVTIEAPAPRIILGGTGP